MNDTCYFTFDLKKFDPTPPHLIVATGERIQSRVYIYIYIYPIYICLFAVNSSA